MHLSVSTCIGCIRAAYHDLVSAQSNDYNPSGLYSTCNVDRPEDCNNSPINGNNSPTSGNNSPTSGPTSGNNSPTNGSVSFASTATLIIAMVCFAALG